MFVCNLGIAQSGIDQREAVALLIPVCPRLKNGDGSPSDMSDDELRFLFLLFFRNMANIWVTYFSSWTA